MARRRPSSIMVTLLLLTACAGRAEVPIEVAPPAAPGSETPDDPPTTETSDPEPPAEERAQATESSAGSDGVGDSLYPGLGNGGYDVERYDLVIDFTPDGLGGAGSIVASAAIRALAADDLSSFNLDLNGLDVHSVTVDGRAAETRRSGSELTVTPAVPLVEGQDFMVVVEYSGSPVPVVTDVTSPVNGWTPGDGGIFVAGEPTGASGWFPVNEHPSDKAEYSITVTAPDDLDVVSNGILAESASNGDGTTTWHYQADAPMASYLVTLAIDDLTFYDQGTFDGVALRHAFADELASAAQADTVRLPEVLAYYTTIFGPFPFDAYGHLVVDTPFSAALETQTLTVFGSDTVNGTGLLSNIVVHELAHQWFGDSVGLADWSDLWLNEGFATYAELLWFEHDGRFTREEIGPLILDAGIPMLPPGTPDPDDLFAPSVYFRGALTLHAIRLTVGDDAFFDILRAWTERFGGTTAGTDDFIALAEEVTSRELRPMIEAWLYADEVPDLPA